MACFFWFGLGLWNKGPIQFLFSFGAQMGVQMSKLMKTEKKLISL